MKWKTTEKERNKIKTHLNRIKVVYTIKQNHTYEIYWNGQQKKQKKKKRNKDTHNRHGNIYE